MTDDSSITSFFARLFHRRRFSVDIHYARDYYLLLKSEYASLDPAKIDKESESYKSYYDLVAQTDKAYADNPNTLTIQQVFKIEMALIGILPEYNLRAKVWSVRDSYRKLVGEKSYQQYIASNPPDTKSEPIDKVRADIIDLVKGKHWWYVNAMVMERGLRGFKVTLFTWMLGGFLVLIVLMGLIFGIHTLIDENHRLYFHVLNIIFITIYAGMLGAIISTARRIKLYVRVPMSDTDPVIRMTGMANGQTGLRLSIISGGVFSLFLYFLFVAGLGEEILSTGLIPLFPNSKDTLQQACCLNSHLVATFCGMIPKDSASIAKLIIWSFIAGFGEKFVPDILDRLSTSSSRSEGSGGTA